MRFNARSRCEVYKSIISMRTLVIREINALKIDVKRFDESCILKYWSEYIVIPPDILPH